MGRNFVAVRCSDHGRSASSMFTRVSDVMGESDEREELCALLDEVCEALDTIDELQALYDRRKGMLGIRFGKCATCADEWDPEEGCSGKLDRHEQRLYRALDAGVRELQGLPERETGGIEEVLESAEGEGLRDKVWETVEQHRPRGGLKRWHYYAAGAAVLSVAWSKRQELKEGAESVGKAAVNFYQERVKQPLVDMYRTVRYDDETVSDGAGRHAQGGAR